MSFYIFFALFVIVFSLQVFTIKKWFIDNSLLSQNTKRYLRIVLYILFILILFYPVARYFPTESNILYVIFSVPIGIIFITFSITLLYKLVTYLFFKIDFNETRRDFFHKTADLGMLSLVVATNAQAIQNANEIEIENVDIKINNLKKSYKMAQLSDIHIGGIIDTEFVSNLVSKTNNEMPDIIVITGDLVDTKLESAKPALDKLKNLKSKYGTFFIVGNHEYFHGVIPIIDYVNSLGIKTLENENVYIGEPNNGFYLCGVYDIFGNRYGSHIPNLAKALENSQNNPTILLAHQPKFINEIKNTKGIDLILCGHTHGGQIFPFNFLVKLQQPYVKGLHQHNEFTKVYVNKGTGFWGPPMRLGTTSEITILNIS